MIAKNLKLLLILLLGVAIGAPLCWADETAYGYIISYSYRDKVVYHTPVFENQVSGQSFNDEEYVTDTKKVMKLESAFQKHIIQKFKLRDMNFTTSARVSYKSLDVARSKLDKESRDFMFKGLKIKKEEFKP